ncbi:hypothetical protein [Luteolibacter marinus]|uniref:hypothetical protein n=1 Tax=Luteolibacter marinus TaxID=2776705 RepID=UPI001866C3E7|nr:hypothetical protein [Luteolibacter marinus]
MKTKSKNQVVVKDGKTRIADWNREFEQHPTVGDRIAIPDDVARNLSGYESEVTVSMVRMDPHTGDLVIEADARCKIPTEQRAVVTLNAGLIPERVRQEAERLLRSRLDHPVIDWEESDEATPIVRIHPFKSELKTPLEQLQEQLREVVLDASKLAHF